MRRSRPLLVLLAVVLFAAAALADERILDFHSDLAVQRNGSLTVHEVVRVNAEGEHIRHGIFREIPTSYKDRLGRQYTVDLKVLDVRRDGSPEPYSQEDLSNGRRILIGSPDRTLDPGQYTYEITYNVTRELGFFAGHDELYWNVTGNGWEFPIDHASATVTLPAAVNAADLKITGYTGVKGSRSHNLTSSIDPSSVRFETTYPLMATEGLTIVVGFPKGLVNEPSRADRLRWMLQDNAPAVAGFLGLLLVAAYYFLAYLRLRGPAPGTIVAGYEPPPGLTPAAMRYLLHMGYDDRALVSSVIDLAVKRCLTIRREERTYQLTRLKRTSGSLPAEERELLQGLFGDNSEITIGSQRGILSIAKSRLIRDLKAQEGHRLFRKNGWWAVPGILLSLATAIALVLNLRGPMAAGAAFMMFWLSGWSFAVIALLLTAVRSWKAHRLALVELLMPLVFTAIEVVVLIVLGVMIGVLPMLMLFGLIAANGFGIHKLRAYTPEGRKLMDQIEGFRLYLVEVDSDRIRRLDPPEKSPALFETLFPYALALGVEQAWAKQFSGVLAQAATAAPSGATVVYTPDWFTTTQWDTFDAGRFTDSFTGDFSSAVSSASTSPGSSSGFSDSGGGGSSGGGGGGGGGGGW